MTPVSEGERITALETSLTDFKDEYRRDMQELKGDVKAGLEQGRMTNGRVNAIETERAAEKAVAAEMAKRRARVRGFLTTWIAPVVAAAAGGAVVLLFS